MQMSTQKAAIAYHELTCIHNHTDGCGWHYEIHNDVHDWNGAAHQSALKAVARIQEVIDKHRAEIAEEASTWNSCFVDASVDLFLEQLKAAKG